MQTPWQIDLFGGLRAQQDGYVITRFATAKTATLLAYLAFFPRRIHAREELADMLWPDADVDAGRASLRQALHSLRRQIEPPGTPPGSILIADRLSVHLNPEAFFTDVAAFDKALKDASRATDAQVKRSCLERAIELYRGELLPGHYDEWVQAERERLAAAVDDAQQQLAALHQAPIAATQMISAAPSPPLPKSRVSPPTSMLPMQFTRFFGRDAETIRIESLLQDSIVRLVTLTGAGGAGKTRLAIETARRMGDDVVFIPLADLADPTLIPDAVAGALHLTRRENSNALEEVVAALKTLSTPLLVLDNLEQMAEGGAMVISHLLTRVPSLTCLVTSRQRLELAGEREFPVAPLPIPAETDSPEALVAFPSAQLFVDRAQASRPDFQVTPRNARAVAALCRRLDGLPLALELAAAWSLVLSPSQMLDRLDTQFQFLVSRRKDTPGHRRTLWATIGWSYDLLPPDLQRFWTGLAVFRGGWTAEAASEVCGEAQALYLLTQLRARSLVTLKDTDDSIRFGMLESLREYAWEQMTLAKQTEACRRHVAYYRTLAEQAKPLLKGPEQAAWLNRLEAEHDNLRTALDRLRTEPDGLEGEMCLAGSLYEFWYLRGHIREARTRYAALLARPGVECAPPQVFGSVLSSAGLIAVWQGGLDEAQTLFERSLSLQRAEGNDEGVAASLSNLALVARRRGENEAAIVWGEQALILRRRLGDDYAISASLMNLGVAYARLDRMVEAEAALTESLRFARPLGNGAHTGRILTNLGCVYDGEGRSDEARACWIGSLHLVQASGSIPNLLPPLLNLINLEQRAGLWERAARLRGAIAALAAKQGLSFASQDRAGLDERCDELKAQMGGTAFDRAWAEGEAMTLEEAIAEASIAAPVSGEDKQTAPE